MATKAFSTTAPSVLSFSAISEAAGSSSSAASVSLSKRFTQQCAQFDIKDRNKIRRLITVLEGCSQVLAQNPRSRMETGTDPKLWTDLRKLWRDLSRQLFSSSFWDNDDDSSSDDEDGDVSSRITSPPTSPFSARFETNGKSSGQHGSKPENESSGQGHTRDLSTSTTTTTASQRSAKQRRKQDDEDRQAGLKALCASLAKFTRNLVAGVKGNQVQAFENEPEIRRLLHYYTSWTEMQDDDSVIVSRLLTQALSNVVTSNEILVEKLWEVYMALPEDEGVLIRLMQSPDSKTLLTSLIFVLNCIHKNKKRTTMLVKSRTGVRICISLLDNMVKLHEAEERSDGAKAFDIGYSIVTQLIEAGSAPDLYRKFRVKSETITPHQTTLLKLIDSYLQSTQLNPPLAAPTPSHKQLEMLMWSAHINLGPFLAKRFFELSEYAQESMMRALGMTRGNRPTVSKEQRGKDESNDGRRYSLSSSGLYSPLNSPTRSGMFDPDFEEEQGPSNLKSTPVQDSRRPSVSSTGSSSSGRARSNSNTGLQQLDTALPTVCEALVLITQCIVTISLEAEEEATRRSEEKYRQERMNKRAAESETRTLNGLAGDYREYLERGITSPRGEGDERTLAGKEADTNTQADEKKEKEQEWVNMKEYFNRKRWEGVGVIESLIEVLSLLDVFLPRINFGKPVNRDGTPSASSPLSGKPKEVTSDPSSIGFSYLKRDLVRLLGVLCAGVKSVQDRTRDAGGLPVVMNLCVIDERNPFLREHAIFTLHNLLKDNSENQKFVDSVKPSQEWSSDGTLKTKVGAKILK
ncbi:spinocerebellar ataxia type 10 protein domain-containing protein [Crepidotus variabilis]|uniref:Ataxin-10 homolog n=1 Tax=Crepidotus variabilis TaxID=179855 RepID=A0A9P6EMP2_9AGAR|nr:spinocerebellar ataxia type 10 protein domain-containing protein [Crepidotus variabilis]